VTGRVDLAIRQPPGARPDQDDRARANLISLGGRPGQVNGRGRICKVRLGEPVNLPSAFLPIRADKLRKRRQEHGETRIAGAIIAVAFTAVASAQNFKMATPIAPGVAVLTRSSPRSDLELNYGYPSPDTVDKIYDNLTFAGTSSLSAGNSDRQSSGMRDSLRKFGPITRPT